MPRATCCRAGMSVHTQALQNLQDCDVDPADSNDEGMCIAAGNECCLCGEGMLCVVVLAVAFAA